METEAIATLVARGDIVKTLEECIATVDTAFILSCDIHVGDTALRAFPSMMGMTMTAIENIRKSKPKPPPKGKKK